MYQIHNLRTLTASVMKILTRGLHYKPALPIIREVPSISIFESLFHFSLVQIFMAKMYKGSVPYDVHASHVGVEVR